MLVEQILSIVPCVVFWKDVNGVFQGCNKHFLDFMGIQDKNLVIGKTDKELPWGDRWKEYTGDDQHVISTGETITTLEMVNTPVKSIMARTTKVQWKQDGNVLGVLVVIHDVTEIMEAKEKVELSNKIKADFIENMQHDLRTPTHGICDSLFELMESENNPVKKSHLARVYRSSKQLLELCVEITEFDKITNNDNSVASKKFDVEKMIVDVVDLNKTAAYKKGLTIGFEIEDDVPGVIKGDDLRLKKILINLVGNAVKFTNKGCVNLVVKSLKNSDRDVVLQFQVHDTGVGIPQDKRHLIYERFARFSTESDVGHHGGGLGLSFVKRFVDDLSGDIEMESCIGQGTIFYVSLPFDLPLSNMINKTNLDEVVNTHCSHARHDVNRVETLLIYDEPLARAVAKEGLESVDCSVTTVDTVEMAKEILKSTKFDVIISDINLPDGTGFDVTGYLKEDKNLINHDTPVFALAAQNSLSNAKAEQAGFIAMLAKPLVPKKFKTILYSHVREIAEARAM